MGVDGLLPFVASASSDCHISRYKGKAVAVDASGWLHRGAHACATELALGTPTERFLGYALRMVKMLQSQGVQPLLVFDGGSLSMKERTRRQREAAREDAREHGRSLHEQGLTAEAHAAFARAVTVTPAMSRSLIEALRRQRVAYVVAPYEADAQLVFLVMRGHCAAAISEDSDLLAYRCPETLYKMDANGYGRRARFDDLQYAEHGGAMLFDGTWPTEWRDWECGLFLDMCVLSGTDHLPGLPGYVRVQEYPVTAPAQPLLAITCRCLLSPALRSHCSPLHVPSFLNSTRTAPASGSRRRTSFCARTAVWRPPQRTPCRALATHRRSALRASPSTSSTPTACATSFARSSCTTRARS